jgi:tetratricopeptide (TPR) repeat protein/tRNA A-37 threonylcarbamoyl transferase component Bud32
MSGPLQETRSPAEDPHGTEDTVRPEPTGAPKAPPVPASQPLPRGASLGRYVVLEHVASGGMGSVYAAYDPQLDRRVALKLILPRHGTAVSEKAKARLRAEAQALARLNHPHVVTVHDVAEDHGRLFVAMEFVDGQDLGAWLRTPRTWQTTLELFTSAARGLAAAHGAGLVHRDFKPPNVLVGSDGRVRVADFGIARRDDDEVLTTTDALLGTPAYMSPEQARGMVADARSDQFSWAVSLHEALFGRRPFDFAALARTEAPALEKPADPGQVPPWLWAVLKKALAWNPAERFTSMDAILQELQAHRERTPRRWAPWLVPAVLGLAAVAYWATDRDRRQRACVAEGARSHDAWNDTLREQLKQAFSASGSPRADDAFATATRTFDGYFTGWARAAEGACVATRVEGVQTERLYELRKACLDARFDEAQALLLALQHADKAMVERAPDAVRGLRRVSNCDHPALAPPIEPSKQAEVNATWVALRKAEALYHLGKNADAITALTDVTKHADGLDDAMLAAEAHNLLGLALAVSGDAKGARLQQHQSAIAAERANDDELKARAWSSLALVEGPLLGNAEEGERMSQYALAAASHLEHAPEVLAMVHSDLGQQAQLRGDWPTALAQSKAAVEALGPSATDDEELLIAARNNEALALSKLGKYPEALELFRRSIAGCVSTVGARHPRCVTALMNLGNTLKKAGNIEEAATTLRQVVDLREQVAPGSSDLGASYSNLAQTLEATHHLDEALSMYQKSLAILEKTLGPEHPNVAIVHANVCNVYLQQQHFDTALRECDQAIHIFLARVPKHPFIADLYVMEAQAQLAQGDLKQAAASIAESTARCDGTACTTQLEPSRTFTRARLALAQSHDRAGALALGLEARAGFEKMKSTAEAEQVTAWLKETGLDAPAP